MGTVFGFVSSDVKEKVEILEKLRGKENADSFLTIRTMMQYEQESNLLNKKDYVSGSRTLLRLHRGLGECGHRGLQKMHLCARLSYLILPCHRVRFSSNRLFLFYHPQRGYYLKCNCPINGISMRIRQIADFIQEFLKRLGELEGDGKTNGVCQAAYNDTLAQFHPWLIRKGATVAMYALPTRDQLLERVCMDVAGAMKLLPEMLSVTRNVYDRTQNLYTRYDLHGLP